ncbi:MAG: prepilin-type N-terminal cleavage/methylation domain-containing protein [Phycisphaerae bacterium]
MKNRKGFTLIETMIAMGIAETVGIFAFVFMFMLLPAAG